MYLGHSLNNFFNNSNNAGFAGSILGNTWETVQTPGTNIIGGPYLGGNAWAQPDGLGFSETCIDFEVGVDEELDMICSSPYVLDDPVGDNVDNLPLSMSGKVFVPPVTVGPIPENTTNASEVFELPQEVAEVLGVEGYQYIVTTNGTTPPIEISINVSTEPPAGVATDISGLSGAIAGFYYEISVNDSSWFVNVTAIELRIYYNITTIDLPSGVSEGSLRPVRFTNGSWVRLDCSALGGCPKTLDDGTELFAAGVVTSAVNATHPYVWANLSNFSVYGIGGSITPAAAAPAPAPGPTGAYKPQAVVLANSIDRALAADFYGFLRNQGIEVIEATAANFAQYRSTARFIIILGGPDAPEGVGDIVKGILAEDEQRFLRARGNRKMYVKTNIYRTGQVVRIIAGSGRAQTQEEWQANKEDVGRRMRYNLD